MANSSSADESDDQHEQQQQSDDDDDSQQYHSRNGNGKYDSYDDDEDDDNDNSQDYNNDDDDDSQRSEMKSEPDDSFGMVSNNNNNNNNNTRSSNNNNNSMLNNHHHSKYKEESDSNDDDNYNNKSKKKKKRKHNDSDEDDYMPKKTKKSKKSDTKHSNNDSSTTTTTTTKLKKKIKREYSDDDDIDNDDDNDNESDYSDSEYKSSSKKLKKSKTKHLDSSGGDKKKLKNKKDKPSSSSSSTSTLAMNDGGMKTKTVKTKSEKDSKSSKDNNKKSKIKKESSSSDGKVEKKRKKKQEEEDEHIWKWWEEESPGEGIKWKTLEHNGPVFPPDYEPLPKKVRFYYDGKHFELSSEAEEVAGFYARMLEHEYTSKDVFNKNFFKDWRKTMNEKERELITDLKKCNFHELNEYFKQQSELRKQMTKEEKQQIKLKNEEIVNKYGYCIVDGHKQKIGNFRIEPPGLFRGRGEHPKMGKLKKRVQPEDIIINIGEKVKIPTPPAGHKWKEVRHDNTVTWLASWTENIMGNVKYIMLNPSSKLKSIKDWQKYEKARELKKYVNKIRSDYRADFKSREMMKRQRAVALYFIDKLALRAGNEKEEGETADTVGCCSLRVEHITLHSEKDGKQYVVDFDFLGKDSIRYVNSVSVEKRVFKNLKHFIVDKSPGDDLFDRLNTSSLNKYLNSLMDGLTAKVFRTYNASNTLQQQLNELTKLDMTMPEKILAYNRANRAVALLCNHQKSVSKTHDKQMENLNGKIKDKKTQIKELKKQYKETKNDAGAKEKYKKKLKTLEEQLKKLEVAKVDKEENKQIALGTSKLNYLDPRISVAWCKKWEVPIEKIYNKTQRDKFRWAIEMVGPDYQF